MGEYIEITGMTKNDSFTIKVMEVFKIEIFSLQCIFVVLKRFFYSGGETEKGIFFNPDVVMISSTREASCGP